MSDPINDIDNDDELFALANANFGWVRNPEAVEAIVSTLPYKDFSETPAAGFAAADLPDHCYLWDFAIQVTGGLLTPQNQLDVGSCFPAGTKIRMADGSYKEIDKISLGDKVVTAEGNTGRVTTCFLKQEKQKLVNFKCHGHYGLEATPEHPVLTQRGYVRMDSLKVGDYVACTKYLPETKSKLHTKDYSVWNIKVTKTARTCVSGSVQGRKKAFMQICPLPESIELNEDFGRLIGLYLAEGSTDHNKVCWTFNIDEKETLAKDVVDILKNELNAESRIKEMPEKNTCKVILHGREWSNLFEKLCGNGSGLKRLHTDLTSGSQKFLKEVFRGWMDGDGHVSDVKNCLQGVTVSHELALNMFDIANKLGLSPSLRKSDPKISHGIKSRKRRYDLVISTGGGLNKPEQDEKKQWRKITKISEKTYSGDVYNIEVEGDNSYVAEGIGVHNCVAFGAERAINYSLCAEIANGAPFEHAYMVQEEIYGLSRVEIGKRGLGRGDGSIGAWGADAVRKFGVLKRDVYLDGKYDLSKYNTTRCRDWGWNGLPDALEPIAKMYPVKETTLVTNWLDCKKALIQGYSISVASDQGFSMRRNANGICKAGGTWHHQMCICGWATIDNEEYGRIDNSWGANAHTGPTGPGNPGPEGFYAHWKTIEYMLKQKDSFAFSGVTGFPLRKLRWKI